MEHGWEKIMGNNTASEFLKRRERTEGENLRRKKNVAAQGVEAKVTGYGWLGGGGGRGALRTPCYHAKSGDQGYS